MNSEMDPEKAKNLPPLPLPPESGPVSQEAQDRQGEQEKASEILRKAEEVENLAKKVAEQKKREQQAIKENWEVLERHWGEMSATQEAKEKQISTLGEENQEKVAGLQEVAGKAGEGYFKRGKRMASWLGKTKISRAGLWTGKKALLGVTGFAGGFVAGFFKSVWSIIQETGLIIKEEIWDRIPESRFSKSCKRVWRRLYYKEKQK